MTHPRAQRENSHKNDRLFRLLTNKPGLLSEFNAAFFAGKDPSLNKVDGLSKDGRSSIMFMWGVKSSNITITQNVVTDVTRELLKPVEN
jgi:hypothetical protein